jgi:hypothetical protein
MTQHFRLTLCVAPGRDGVRSLRALLKIAGRHLGLHAIACEETTNNTPPQRSVECCNLSSAKNERNPMDMRKFSGSTFVKVADVRSGQMQEKIASVEIGQFGKPDITFESGAKLSINATNNKTLMRAFGTDSDGWIGHVVELYLGEIDYQGKPQEAVLLRAVDGSTSRKKPSKPAPDEIDFGN